MYKFRTNYMSIARIEHLRFCLLPLNGGRRSVVTFRSLLCALRSQVLLNSHAVSRNVILRGLTVLTDYLSLTLALKSSNSGLV